jgi:transposase
MIDITTVKYVYIAKRATDLRKDVDGYANIVSAEFQLDPFSNSLFIFCNRYKDKIKILYWDYNGFWLFYKRLEQGTFKWGRKSEEGGGREITMQQLRWLLEGLEIDPHRGFKEVKNKVI